MSDDTKEVAYVVGMTFVAILTLTAMAHAIFAWVVLCGRAVQWVLA